MSTQTAKDRWAVSKTDNVPRKTEVKRSFYANIYEKEIDAWREIAEREGTKLEQMVKDAQKADAIRSAALKRIAELEKVP